MTEELTNTAEWQARKEQLNASAFAFKESVRDFVDALPYEDAERLFEIAFPDKETLNIRGAKIGMVTSAVAWLSADLRAEMAGELTHEQ